MRIFGAAGLAMLCLPCVIYSARTEQHVLFDREDDAWNAIDRSRIVRCI
jgi:hypothetical protein